MSAIISSCGHYRYRLERDSEAPGHTVAVFGVNPSTADATTDDATVRKWRGFAMRNGWTRIIVGNAHAYRAKNVGELKAVPDPVGPDNWTWLEKIIQQADVLWPCWGSRDKLPRELHTNLYRLKQMILGSGKPVVILGLTKTGDPMHPLMVGYDTALTPWKEPNEC